LIADDVVSNMKYGSIGESPFPQYIQSTRIKGKARGGGQWDAYDEIIGRLLYLAMEYSNTGVDELKPIYLTRFVSPLGEGYSCGQPQIEATVF
jgi:hypothetical protein